MISADHDAEICYHPVLMKIWLTAVFLWFWRSVLWWRRNLWHHSPYLNDFLYEVFMTVKI